MKKLIVIHLTAAVVLSFLLYKFATTTLGVAIFIGAGTAFLRFLYAMKREKIKKR